MSGIDFRHPFFRRPWVRVRNTASEAAPPYAVLRITGESTEDEDGEIVIEVAKPNTTFLSHYLVNGPWAIEPEGEGVASFLSEIGYIQIALTGSAGLGEHWGPSNDSWVIRAGGYGFILYGGHRTVGDYRVAAARQYEVQNIIGVIDGNTAKDAVATVSVYDGTGDTGQNINTTVLAAAVTAGGYCGVTRYAAGWHMDWAECDP